MNGERLATSTGVELIAIAAATHAEWKEVGQELARRAVDPLAAGALIDGYVAGQMPPWFVAYLLGCVRAPEGYAVAREILLAAPGLLAESYAGPAMARIAGIAAHDDLTHLMMEAPRLRSREGAAYGLGTLHGPGSDKLLLQAVQAGRVRVGAAAGIIASLPEILPTLLIWIASEDAVTERVAAHAGFSLLARTATKPDVELAHAMRRVLDAGRVKLAPSVRRALVERIASVR